MTEHTKAMDTRSGKVDQILSNHSRDIADLNDNVAGLWAVLAELSKAESIESAKIVRKVYEALNPDTLA